MVELAELFAERRSTTIQYDGELVHGVYEFERVPRSLAVTFVRATQAPVQGLRLKIRGGVFDVPEERGIHDLVLWTDTAPGNVVVSLRNVRPDALLKVWNVWRRQVGGHAVTQAWLGNAGMRVSGAENRLLLRCSDGEGPVAFDDLEAVVESE
ncbi:hypothetical protein M3147_08490 [Agromyces mediolanus]|uniref:hypothetical protein n=1 Tax=Agromyces mediolanus TaxID=41986 RepID=UPI00203C188A|nr:hypothetical protein [Agromyces mediolanus]MCM3657287.1 hypothetical protein [Agromyces mediolanus]